MGAVPIIVIGRFFPVHQIQKANNAVLWLKEIGNGGNARIQKGNGKGRGIFFGGKKPMQERHEKQLLSLLRYVKKYFWGLLGISL